MMIQCTGKRRRSEGGYAVLGTIAIIGMVAATAVTTLGTANIGNRQSSTTAAALAQAKLALISRAASDSNHPGSLPCPDAVTNIAGNNVPNDGIADLLAGTACPSIIGHLPWRTLGLPDLRDADGERLWYMVAPGYQDSSAKVINPGTSGQITGYECDGTPPATQTWPCDTPRAVAATPWVAVVFAPGKILGGQLRDPAHANDFAQFLESYNPADPLRLRVEAGTVQNDRIAAISADDIFALTQRRVANELQVVLARYYATTAARGKAGLPWPAATCTSSTVCPAAPISAPLPPTARGYLPSDDADLNQIMAEQNMAWFDRNHWRTTVSYVIDANCTLTGNVTQCGGTFATLSTAPLPGGTTVIGSVANAFAPGTRAIIAFSGIAGGTAKTQIATAIQ